MSSAATYAPIVATSATYYVSIYDPGANCEGTRSAVSATTSAAPVKPTITYGGELTFCAGDAVTLNAPGGNSGYLWSDGTTLQSNKITTSGSLTVQVINASGCKSVASDAVEVDVYAAPDKPMITGSRDICNGKSASLSGLRAASQRRSARPTCRRFPNSSVLLRRKPAWSTRCCPAWKLAARVWVNGGCRTSSSCMPRR